MKISADSSKGRLNCGQTHGKILSRGDRVFTNPDQEKEEPPVVSAQIKEISHLSS